MTLSATKHLESMNSCLIGYTGFVGNTLRQQHSFSHLFNRSNIESISDCGHLDLAVCAAAPGSMFQANRHPDEDRQNLNNLKAQLSTLKVDTFILISSIAVLGAYASGLDEKTDQFETDTPYGAHRRDLEEFCQDQFNNTLVARLPALFGPGLKKNFIFDVLNPVPSMLTSQRLCELPSNTQRSVNGELASFYHQSAGDMFTLDRDRFNSSPQRDELEAQILDAEFDAVRFHNPSSTYQYYNMTRLWSDITRSEQAELSHIHLATEPLELGRIHKTVTGADMPGSTAAVHHEDMRTSHADLWGQSGTYIDNADSVLHDITQFCIAEQGQS